MAERAPDRLTRLLALVAYLSREGSAHVDELAEHFGVTPAQIVADVSLLWVTGTPGYLPDDLIDFSANDLDHGVVTLVEDRGFAAPLRLSAAEATMLAAGLHAILAEPGLADAQVVGSALRKIEDAAGISGAAASGIEVDLADGAPPGVLKDLRAAMAGRRRIELDYTGADSVRRVRRVDPIRVFTDGSRWFLSGWDIDADGERFYRLDRIDGIQAVDVAALEHPTEPIEGAFSGRSEFTATIRIAPRLRWVLEELPSARIVQDEGSSTVAELDVAQMSWFVSFVLGYGDQIEVVGPERAKAAVSAAAGGALNSYARLLDIRGQLAPGGDSLGEGPLAARGS